MWLNSYHPAHKLPADASILVPPAMAVEAHYWAEIAKGQIRIGESGSSTPCASLAGCGASVSQRIDESPQDARDTSQLP